MGNEEPLSCVVSDMEGIIIKGQKRRKLMPGHKCQMLWGYRGACRLICHWEVIGENNICRNGEETSSVIFRKEEMGRRWG